MSRRKRTTRTTYRSKFEQKIATQLEEVNIPFDYEKIKLRWTEPAKDRVYTPDFYLKEQQIIVETKGFWKPQDRLKMLFVIEQHPDRDIRMVFQDANKKINKGSSTTYADWCDKYGIKWAHKEVPTAWITEKTLGLEPEV